jgi:hypothetical protein
MVPISGARDALVPLESVLPDWCQRDRYYGLHSTPTELRYDAFGTRSKTCLVAPTRATVVAEAESACRYPHRAVLSLLPILPFAAS